MGVEDGKNGNEGSENKESSFSPIKEIGKLWDKITSSESTDEQKIKMKAIIDKQKQELIDVINNYKASKADIVGSSGKNKVALLKDVEKVVTLLKEMNDGNKNNETIQNTMKDVYSSLEAKITGTKEEIDFKDPEFITQALANLTQFEEDLNTSQIVTETPEKTDELTNQETQANNEINQKPENKEQGIKYINYTIKHGDNLTKIAKNHGTTVDALVKLNNIKNKNIIKEGATIKISNEDNKATVKSNTAPQEISRVESTEESKNLKLSLGEQTNEDNFKLKDFKLEDIKKELDSISRDIDEQDTYTPKEQEEDKKLFTAGEKDLKERLERATPEDKDKIIALQQQLQEIKKKYDIKTKQTAV